MGTRKICSFIVMSERAQCKTLPSSVCAKNTMQVIQQSAIVCDD